MSFVILHKMKLKKMICLPFELTKIEKDLIETRLAEFKEVYEANNSRWFSELCFCILTANSQAQKAIDIQKAIGEEGFLYWPLEKITASIRSYGHRFHNLKAKYIVEARNFINIKDIIINMDCRSARDFLTKNIKGIGYKEASHFLRNVGYKDCAIIDRHIIRFLAQYSLIKEIPKTITKKIYLELEEILDRFKIEHNKLDLLIWCYITGKVLK